jgi:hypothetical protein
VTDIEAPREGIANSYRVALDTTEIPEGDFGGGYATSPNLKAAKEIAREGHAWDGRARLVFKGKKVYLRIPENPDHEKPSFQVMPDLSEEEYQALKESIAERGLDYQWNRREPHHIRQRGRKSRLRFYLPHNLFW